MVRRWFRHGSMLAGLAIVVLFLFMAVLSPWLPLPDPALQSLRSRLLPPLSYDTEGQFHLLGTDQLGRDILARVLYGGRVSLLVAGMVVAAGGVIGVCAGLVAGYFGGWVDRLLMRLIDVQMAFPAILLVLPIVTVLGPSLINIMLVLALTSWIRYARVIRNVTLSLKEQSFVEAAAASGASPLRILTKEVLPNVINASLVIASLEVGRAIIMEASLSFLGLGPSMITWGQMLSDARSYVAEAWWLPTFPGLAITSLVLGVNLLGDGLRDLFDPQSKRGRNLE